MIPHTIDGKHGKNQLQIHRERLRTREAATMASQNGLTNGHNGTTVVPEVEQEIQQLEVKSIQNISIQSESVQDEVLKPEIQQDIASTPIQSETVQEDVSKPEIQPDVARIQAEINHPDIIQPVVQEPATPIVDEVVTLPVEVNVQAAVVETPQEVAVTVTKDDASPQPQVIVETPTITQEVKAVSAPTNVVDQPIAKVPGDQSIVVPGNQPGTSDFQVPQYAITAINRIAQDEGFTNYAINYDRGSNFGDGFVAEIVRAKIKGLQLVKGVQEESELVLMVKLPPDNKTRREQMGMNVFDREVTVYNEILPMFQKFQLDKGLKPGQGFVSFPKCYFASFDKEKDESVIIMEDIRKKGFKMLNKYKYVDYPHAAAVLETIAQFHGLSLAMKDQCPGLFDKFKGLKDAMTDGMLTDMMKSLTAASCEKAIEALEPHEENIKQKLRAFSENVIDIIKTCTNGELSEPYSVINHGDCWVNNMMFKYEVKSVVILFVFSSAHSNSNILIFFKINFLSERNPASYLSFRLANFPICITSS